MGASIPGNRKDIGRQEGQSVVEFLVAIVAFGTLLLGIFQAALLYRAKTTVDYAAFRAARQGSLHGATQESVDNGLAKGLMPLYATDTGAVELGKAFVMAKAVELANQATAEIVSPTKDMFEKLAVPQFDGVKAIPNDDLAYRSAEVRAANLLKVKVTYDYPLIVPVIDTVIGRLFGQKKIVPHADGSLRTMWVLPIQAQAVVNMQSPIRDANALSSGNGGNPPPGDGGGGSDPLPPGGGGWSPPGGGTNPPGGGINPPGEGGTPPTHPICTGHL